MKLKRKNRKYRDLMWGEKKKKKKRIKKTKRGVNPGQMFLCMMNDIYAIIKIKSCNQEITSLPHKIGFNYFLDFWWLFNTHKVNKFQLHSLLNGSLFMLSKHNRQTQQMSSSLPYIVKKTTNGHAHLKDIFPLWNLICLSLSDNTDNLSIKAVGQLFAKLLSNTDKRNSFQSSVV